MDHMMEIFGRVPSKKNSKRPFMTKARDRAFIVSSSKYLDWVKEQEKTFGLTCPKGLVPIYIDLYFWMPDNRRCDLTNKAESIMDLLVSCGVIEDDCWQVTGSVKLIPMGIDKENPRVGVVIFTSSGE